MPLRARVLFASKLAFACAAALGSSAALALPLGDPGSCLSFGPDVVVGDIPTIGTDGGPGVRNYTATAGMDAIAIATYACNVGTVDLRWWAFVNKHPVIGGTLYTRKQVNGSWRFEQLGQSWLKHGFYADQFQERFCCPTCTVSNQGDPGEFLGIGCADQYNATRNGIQGTLGPKSEINPHTGAYFFDNWTTAPINPPFSGNGRRVQVPLADLAPSSATVQYFVEAQYVTADDAEAGNQNNNASYRAVTVTGGPSDYAFTLASTTQQKQAALRAWKDSDPSVLEVDVQVPDDGLFIVACQVTNLNNGWWHYEYAVQNLNAHRAANSFTVPVPGCATVQNIGFHDVAYRDGDGYNSTSALPVNYDGTDWPGVRLPSSVTWNTASFAVNPNANALRWGTTYNFRFDANKPPIGATATIGLYRPGRPPNMPVTLQGPSGGEPPSCPADVANNNGIVNTDDLLLLLGNWGPTPAAGDCFPPCGDGVVNTDDLLAMLGAWGPCP